MPPASYNYELNTRGEPPTREDLDTSGLILEAWAQGYNIGSLVILILIVFCNYRSGIWLHKLILLELFLALWHGTFIFLPSPAYNWYLSSTAFLLFLSYQLHNVVSWLKIRPFLPLWGSRVFIISLVAIQPFWVAETWSNFAFWNGAESNAANLTMRPWEAIVRDPWWIFTTWKLVSAIKKTYGIRLVQLVRINSRFGIMLLCMFLSIVFLIIDIVLTFVDVYGKTGAASGINPFWRLALVFKCASDTIFLDDFKSVLDAIVAVRLTCYENTTGLGTGFDAGSSSGESRKRSIRDGTRTESLVDVEAGGASGSGMQMSASKQNHLSPMTAFGNHPHRRRHDGSSSHHGTQTTEAFEGRQHPSEETLKHDFAFVSNGGDTLEFPVAVHPAKEKE